MKKLFILAFILAAFAANNASAQSSSGSSSGMPAVNAVGTPSAPETAASTTETTKTTQTTTDGTTTTTTSTTTKTDNNLENILYLDLKDGRVVIQLLPEVAPNHVKRIKELVREGFYDGVPFHRVIDGFMAQTGDPTGTGSGGSGQKIDAEFNSEKHVRGTVSMARAADPNSADSQFFIMFDEAPHLDGNYTVFGKVIEGMEFVDKIKKGTGPNGMVTDPDKIIKLRVAADVKDDATAPAATTSSSTTTTTTTTAPATSNTTPKP